MAILIGSKDTNFQKNFKLYSEEARHLHQTIQSGPSSG